MAVCSCLVSSSCASQGAAPSMSASQESTVTFSTTADCSGTASAALMDSAATWSASRATHGAYCIGIAAAASARALMVAALVLVSVDHGGFLRWSGRPMWRAWSGSRSGWSVGVAFDAVGAESFGKHGPGPGAHIGLDGVTALQSEIQRPVFFGDDNFGVQVDDEHAGSCSAGCWGGPRPPWWRARPRFLGRRGGRGV
ncbi:hypothetical protein ARUE_113p00420 (plasmid) [Arthrobacter sp. Rue61a]|nr:hypothetical protein ARUE_113p00420 [Arthrobacter sp. Rue61a]